MLRRENMSKWILVLFPLFCIAKDPPYTKQYTINLEDQKRNAFFLLDVSGSMEPLLAASVGQIGNVIQEIERNDLYYRATLHTFSGCASGNGAFPDWYKIIVPFGAGSGKEVVRAAGNLRAYGWTDILGAVERATAYLRETIKMCPKFMMITDNRDTCGPRHSARDFRPAILKFNEICTGLNIVMIKSVQQTVNAEEAERYLESMAALANGAFHTVEKVEEVGKKIRQLLSEDVEARGSFTSAKAKTKKTQESGGGKDAKKKDTKPEEESTTTPEAKARAKTNKARSK